MATRLNQIKAREVAGFYSEQVGDDVDYLIATLESLMSATVSLLMVCAPTGEDTRTDRAMKKANDVLAIIEMEENP